MKITEIVKPHVYLDMDGVQADFYQAVHDLIGMNYEKTKQKTEEEIEKLANSSSETVREFFANLKQLPGGKKITDWLEANNIPYTILSAPLRGEYSQASIEGKIDWLKKHTPNVANTALFMHDKFLHATTNGIPNILVDDYYKKIDAWNEHGGIGILHADEHSDPNTADKTIAQLKKALNI